MSNSKHPNGVTESTVKHCKLVPKSLIQALCDAKLTLNEMFTLLAEIGNLLNEMPIGTKGNSGSSTDYWSPKGIVTWKVF